MKTYREMAVGVFADIKKRKEQKRKRIRTMVYTLSCICLVSFMTLSAWQLGLLKGKENALPGETIPPLSEPVTGKDEPGMELPEVIWGDKSDYPSGAADAVGYGPKLSDYYKDYDDDTLLAWVVMSSVSTEKYTSIDTKLKIENTFAEYVSERDRIVKRLITEKGMSPYEAKARKFNDSEFIELHDRYMSELYSLKTEIMRRFYAAQSGKLERLSEFGVIVVYTAENEAYQGYLHNFSGLGVIAATRNQLRRIMRETSEGYHFFPAVQGAEYCEHYDLFDRSFNYTVSLADGEKITADAKEAFENAGDEKVSVALYLAYRNDKVYEKGEAQALALAQMGMTYDQVMNSNDIDLIQRMISLTRYIDSDSAFVDGVTEKVLREGEYSNDLPWSKIIYAEVTYERALEIAECDDIAYIELRKRPTTPLEDNLLGFIDAGALE